MNTKSGIPKKQRKSRTEKERERMRTALNAYFSAGMELSKDDVRAANAVIEETLRDAFRLDGEVTLKNFIRSPDELITAFEKRWGPIGPERAIPMPPPPDIPSEPEFIMNRNEPLIPCEAKRTSQGV
jgi:hypothetical protein